MQDDGGTIAIGMLKDRFRALLDTLPMQRADLIPRCIILCCIVHNMYIDNGDFADIVEVVPPPDHPARRFEVDAASKRLGAAKRHRIIQQLARGGNCELVLD